MKLNKDTAKDIAGFVGPGAAVLGAGYADLQHTKSVSKKEHIPFGSQFLAKLD